MKLTREFINALKPTSKREYSDDELPGLRLKVSPTAKSWSVLTTLPDGKRKRITIGSALIITPRQAREKGRQLAAGARLGIVPKKSKKTGPTVAKLAEAYQQSHEWDRLAPSTKRNWQAYLSRHILPHLGARDPESVTRHDVRSWAGKVAKETPTAANRSMEALRRLFNWAIGGSLINCVNPCTRLAKPSPEKRRERVYTTDEIKRALAATAGTPVEVLFRLLMFTLLRSGEARAIRLSWFDWEAHLMTVPAPETKGRAVHQVPLSPDATFLLRGMWRITDESPVDRAKRKAAPGADPALFPANTRTGTMGLPHRLMREIGEKAGIKELWLHDVRRTGASIMDELKVPDDVIESALAHSRPSLVRVYRPGFPVEKVRAAMNTLADHWTTCLGSAWWEPDPKKRDAIAGKLATLDLMDFHEDQ